MKKKKSGKINKQKETPIDQIRNSVGRKIKQEREIRQQSAERIAKKIGISRVALTHIENGRNNINAVQLWRLACAFGCSISDFFPPIPKGFAVTDIDYKKIAKEDDRAVSWARELFSDEFNEI